MSAPQPFRKITCIICHSMAICICLRSIINLRAPQYEKLILPFCFLYKKIYKDSQRKLSFNFFLFRFYIRIFEKIKNHTKIIIAIIIMRISFSPRLSQLLISKRREVLSFHSVVIFRFFLFSLEVRDEFLLDCLQYFCLLLFNFH